MVVVNIARVTTVHANKTTSTLLCKHHNTFISTNLIPTGWRMMKMAMHNCRRKYDDNVKRMVCCWVNSLLIVFTVTSNQIGKQYRCAAYTSFYLDHSMSPCFYIIQMNISDGYRFVATFPKLLRRYTFMWYQSTNEVMCFTIQARIQGGGANGPKTAHTETKYIKIG